MHYSATEALYQLFFGFVFLVDFLIFGLLAIVISIVFVIGDDAVVSARVLR